MNGTVTNVRMITPELDDVDERFGGFAVDIDIHGERHTAFVAVDVVFQNCCEQAGFHCNLPNEGGGEPKVWEGGDGELSRAAPPDGWEAALAFVKGARVTSAPRFAVASETRFNKNKSPYGDDEYGEEIFVETDRGRIVLGAWNYHNGYYPHDGVARLPGKTQQYFSF